MKTAQKTTVVTKSNGNVFADLGLPRADDALAKAELAARIARILKARGWTQVHAASVLGIDQAKVSALVRGHLSGFSTDRLMRLLTTLGHNIEIVVHAPSTRRCKAHVSVRDARSSV